MHIYMVVKKIIINKLMKVLISPKQYEGKKNENIFLFLGGPIQGAEDWQNKVCDDLSEIDNLLITNPRRSNYNGFNLNEQISWETEYLNDSDILMFWIPKEEEIIEGRVYGQTTRFEIGEWVAKSRHKIIIGIDDSFPMKKYLKNRLEKDYGIDVKDTYSEVLTETKKRIKELNDSKPTVFFTSDNHFGSKRTLELSKRPFESVEEMDRVMINNWNSKIKPNDYVYHLGDFGDYSVLDKLNGQVFLIVGNYELDEINKDFKSDYKSFKKYLTKIGFKNVYQNLMLPTKIKEEDVLKLDKFKDIEYMYLTHEPLSADKSMFNLFGHAHCRQMIKRYGLDVGVDGHHFYPITMDDVLFYKTAIEKFYDDNVFE